MEVDEKKILIKDKTSWNIFRGVQNIIHVELFRGGVVHELDKAGWSLC